MFVLNLKLNRRSIYAFLIGATAISVFIIAVFYFKKPPKISGEDTLSRRAYLNSLGYEVVQESEETTLITIPDDFSNTYKNYNKKQTDAGFNLLQYKGYDATVYTYLLTNFEGFNSVYANLIIINNCVVGGDISTIQNGGFILPLKTYKENLKIIEKYVATT